jgi:hypothetical protein
VIGKVVAHGRRSVIPRLFRESRGQLTATEAMISLTPHKLFRRAFLEQHNIRSPEGPRHLEDHYFVTHAYLHASTISVYAGQVCYHHNHPGDDNFSQSTTDAVAYVANNREVIELIARHTEHDPELLRALLQRPVIHELVKKASPRVMRQPDDDREAQKLDAIRSVLRETIPAELIDDLGAFYRATARALLAGDRPAVQRIDERAAALSLAGEVTAISATGSSWTLDYMLSLHIDGVPARLHPDGTDTWRLDESVLPAELQDHSDRPSDLLAHDPEVLLVSRRTDVQWHLRSHDAVEMTPYDDPSTATVALTIVGHAELDPLSAAGGSPLTSGIWDAVVRAEVLGVELRTRLVGSPELEMPSALGEAATSASPFLTTNRQTLAVDVGRPGRSRRAAARGV